MITFHAIRRYRERIDDVPDIVAEVIMIVAVVLNRKRKNRLERKTAVICVPGGFLIGSRGSVVTALKEFSQR